MRAGTVFKCPAYEDRRRYKANVIFTILFDISDG
jgi:hypothetical protein